MGKQYLLQSVFWGQHYVLLIYIAEIFLWLHSWSPLDLQCNNLYKRSANYFENSEAFQGFLMKRKMKSVKCFQLITVYLIIILKHHCTRPVHHTIYSVLLLRYQYNPFDHPPAVRSSIRGFNQNPYKPYIFWKLNN